MAHRSHRTDLTRRKILRLVERVVLLFLVVLFTYLLTEYHDRGGRQSATIESTRSPTPAKNRFPTRPPVGRQQLGVMTWNLDWFQDPSRGPRDDNAQYQGVKWVIRHFPMALIGLVEVASAADFYRLVGDTGGYSGVLSTYRQTQKTGLLFSDAQFELEESRPLKSLTTAGRPPLEVCLRRRVGGSLVVIVIHAKAFDDRKSYRERVRFSKRLKAYLDKKRAHVPLIVLGDFNDLLYQSITPDMPSPYQNFVDDSKYLAATKKLNTRANGERSGRWGSTIDHIILSDELVPRLVEGSVEVIQTELPGRLTPFTRKVSDHYPVTLSLKM